MAHSKGEKLMRQWIKTAEEAGWRVEPSRDGYKFWHPNGVGRIFMHSPANEATKGHLANIRGQFRRMGLEVE